MNFYLQGLKMLNKLGNKTSVYEYVYLKITNFERDCHTVKHFFGISYTILIHFTNSDTYTRTQTSSRTITLMY